MRNLRVLTLSILLVIVCLVKASFADQRWMVEREVDEWERSHKCAVVENSKGYRFAVLGTKVARNPDLYECTLYVPQNRVKKMAFLTVQIDDSSPERLVATPVAGGSGAFVIVDKGLIQQLRRGSKLYVKYYGISGWRVVQFTLNGSSESISKALH